MRVTRWRPLLVALLIVVGASMPAARTGRTVIAAPAVPEFVRASGTSLTLSGDPFRLKGAAIYGTSNPGGPASASQVLDWAAAAHLNTIRLVNMFDERGLDDLAPYDATNWAHVDQLLADISARGMVAILDLSAFRNHLVKRDIRLNGWDANCASGGNRAPVDYELINPYRPGLASEWQAFIDFVTTRVNTVNGVTYRDDPTIAVISLAGEPQPPESAECGKATTTAGLTEFYRSTLEMLRLDDPNHLRSSGGLIHLDWQQLYGHSSGIDGEAIFALADNTLPALHTYPPAYETDGTPIDYQSPALGPYVTGLGKPWFTEEFGWTQNVGDTTRASRYGWLYEEQYTYGSSGALFWNLGPEIAGGSHDANPSTPITWSVIVAAAGALDPTFGAAGTGKVVTTTGAGNDMIQGIVLQPDGKIVVAGGSADVAVARYNRNGSPDSTFGTNGVVITDFGSNSDAGRAVALQPDGKIVVVATQGCCGGVAIALARYNADGTLDPTFGTGGTTTLAGPGVENYAQAIAVQPDGKILVGGSKDFLPLVVRLNGDGTFDTTFGAGGAAVPFPDQGQTTGLAVLQDGRIIAGGYRYSGSGTHSDFEIIRLNTDGSADTTFGPGLDGRVLADLNGNSDDVAFGVAIQGDGRIVMAGSSQKGFQPYDFAVARFTAGGSLDAAFGTGGVVNTNLGADEQGRALALTADQRIIVAGQSTGNQQSDFAIAAYNRDGSLDLNFGTDGVVKTDFQNSDDKGFAVVVQRDGKIVTGGYTIAGSYKFALARYFGGVGSTPTAGSSPDAPTGVTAAAGDAQAVVSWTAPASDGGSPITAYSVTAAPGGASASAGADDTSVSISGLSNGTPYTFTVTATNAIGTSPASDPSAPVTPQAGAPPPQTASETVPPEGGSASTGTSASAADPITTSVTVPATAAGGSVTIAETAVGETPPSGYTFLGQQIDITSTAATSASNPLSIAFTIDASLLLAATGMSAPPPGSVDVTRAEGGGAPVVVLTCATTGPPINPDPCVSDRHYVGDDLAITILTGSASHWNTAVRPTGVTVSNAGYAPKTRALGQGGIALWTFTGSKTHSVTDSLKLGPAKAPLFTSGPLTSGGRFGAAFRAAGTYAYGSTVKGDPGSFAGSVAVPVRISPSSGGPTTSFTVTWSSSTLSGYVFDVQYRFMKAGGKSWSALKAWKTGVSTTTATFSPTSGNGTYAFSARLRNSATGMASLWSPETTIVVAR